MMDGARQYILLADDDPSVREGLALSLEREGRTIVVCADVEAAEIALGRFDVTHIVTDIRFGGEFGFEGLHFLRRAHERAPRAKIIVITGYATEALRSAAMGNGASVLLEKPFRCATLDSEIGIPAGEGDACVIRIPAMKDLLGGAGLTSAFQPIVRFAADCTSAFAFEALTRASGNWMVGGPSMLFDYAERCETLAELNIFTLRQAIASSVLLSPDALLFVNVDPLAFGSEQLVPALRAAAASAERPLNRIVIEITERSGFADADIATRRLRELRALGLRFALDDHGCAYSHLPLIAEIQPSFMKIGHTFGTGFEHDATKVRIIRHTIGLAREFACEPILEGVETAATARAALDAGVTLAQGFFFGRPLAASSWTCSAGGFPHAA